MNAFDDCVTEYDSWFLENDKIFSSELNTVKSLLDDNCTYIEVGVGTGIFASKLGIKEGVEPSKAMANGAIKRGIKVIDGVAENLPYNDSSIEGITMITVDCFIKEIDVAFNEAYRVLKNGGSYVIAFLDKNTPLGQEYVKNKDSNDFYRTAIFRSFEDMKSALNKAGFKIIDCKQTVYSFDNKVQPIKNGNGEGVFAVIKAKKEI